MISQMELVSTFLGVIALIGGLLALRSDRLTGVTAIAAGVAIFAHLLNVDSLIVGASEAVFVVGAFALAIRSSNFARKGKSS